MFLRRKISFHHYIIFVILMLCFSSIVYAKPPVYSDIMPLSHVKPGMKGYGLTTFKGTAISRFSVTIVGILKKENSGHDLILIRMKGGPITERGANLIQGMSGSPIYINGKVIGAFSMGEEFPKEPVGMVTPIEDMLEAWDPDIPQKPSYFNPAMRHAGADIKPNESISLKQPIHLDGRKITHLVLNASRDTHSTDRTASLHLANTLLTVSGIDAPLKEWFQKELDKRGFALTVTGGSGAGDGSFAGVPLKPGSAFGTFLSTGDIMTGGTGTVTYRRGNRMLGFGHPLFGLGALNAAITSAYIVDIFSGLQVSHHIAIAGPIIGTLEQDRDFSVSGEIGTNPAMIPVSITVRDSTTNRNQSFSCQIFQNPDLSPLLLRLVARSAIRRVHGTPGDVMAKVTTSIQADDVGKITRFNTYFDSNDISSISTTDIADITNITSSNPFAPLPIRRMDMYVDISNGHNTAGIERIFLKQGRYEPGETLDVGVALKPYRGEQQVQNLKIKIPADLPTGRYQLVVRGGQANVMRFGSFILSNGPQDQRTPPVNVLQMVNRLKDKESNTDLIAILQLNTAAPALEGEKLSQLPPNISALMRSDRNSGVRLERDELRQTSATSYIVSGQQTLMVMIVRKNTQEPPAGNNYNGPSSQAGGSVNQPSLPGIGTPGAPFNEEMEAEGTHKNIHALRNSVSPILNDTSPLNLSQETEKWMVALLPPKPSPSKPKTTVPPSAVKNSADPKIVVTVESLESPVPVNQDPPNEKPVGRQVQVWRQTAKSDFAAGKFDGASVTAAGLLELAPTLKLLVSTPETYIWCLASAPDGTIYAGTGTSGKILKISAAGVSTLLCQLPVVSVQSLLIAKDGSLWAGSGLKGRVYRIAPDGRFTLVCTLRENYILSMVQNSRGDIYLGVGGTANIYKIPFADQNKTSETTPVLVLESKSDHILCMTIDSKDNIYAGAGNAGILYKISVDGTTSALYDAKDNAITACTADKSGNIYIGTGPRASISRIAPDGTATPVFDKPGSFYTAMRTAPDGSLYASTVNTVYHIFPTKDGSWQRTNILPLDNPRDVDFLSIAILPNGGVAAGTGNVGEIYISQPSTVEKQTGTFESVIHDAKIASQWGEIRWQGSFPTGLVAHVYTRTGPLSEPDISWSKWELVKMRAGLANEGRVISPSARFIQYRIVFEGNANQNLSENSPGIREISIGYMPKNQPPRVVFQSPLGGENWSHSQQPRWQALDADNDTLTYTLSCTSDDGVSWKPIESLETSNTVSLGKTSTVDELKKNLDSDKAISDKLKNALVQGAGTVSAGSSAKTSSLLKENSKRWDTSRMTDGVYRLRVVASDAVSNAVDSLTGEAISEPFIICNALPVFNAAAPGYTADHRVQITGTVSQGLAAIIGVQFRIDGGDWTAAVPQDGLFDSSREEFRILSSALTTGKHSLEIQAFNSAGNHKSEMINIDVP